MSVSKQIVLQDEKLKLSHMVFIKKYFVKHLELVFHTLKFHIKD